VTMTTTSPYADAYDAYWRAGWRGILPLPYGKKAHPPTGYTGYDGADPSYADCATWAMDGQHNVALHLPTDVVGIDVDAYDDKVGGDTLAGLVDKYGALPPTFLSTSRDDGISGIRVFRVPPGTVLPTKLPGIEFIQKHHRYLVAAPSVHPNGGTYRWIDERTGLNMHEPPRMDDIPVLPAAWIGGLAVESRHAVKADIDAQAAATILGEMPDGDPCDHILRHAGKALSGGDRHDSYNEAVLAVVGAGRRGCPGARTVVGRLRKAFVSEISGQGERATVGEAEAEWRRGLMGAIAIVADEDQGAVCPDDVFQWVESLPPAGAEPEATEGGEVVEETAYDREVRRRYTELRMLEDAKGMLAALKAGQAPPLDAVDLSAFLAQEDEPERYRVDQLWPAEGRVLLAAAAKSGKTTMVAANLIPCLVDGGDFLGKHSVQPVSGRVAYLNMEVGERTLRRWMRDADIENTDAVAVVNLRGKSSALALASEAGRKRFAAFLRDLQAEVVILDPLAPVLASLGLDENDNSQVAQFFAWWSESLAMAGIIDDLVVHHTGHAGQRSRGASRLLDEPDAIWTLTKDAEEDGDSDDPYGAAETRYLAAYGRDVDMPAEALVFDAGTRELRLTGMGRAAVSGDKVERRIRRVMADGASYSRSGICDRVKGNRQAAWDKVADLIASGALVTNDKGKTYVWPDAVGGAS
jgi:hypothetical protein